MGMPSSGLDFGAAAGCVEDELVGSWPTAVTPVTIDQRIRNPAASLMKHVISAPTCLPVNTPAAPRNHERWVRCYTHTSHFCASAVESAARKSGNTTGAY